MEAVDLCTLDTGWLPSCHIRGSCTWMPKVRIANVAHADNRTEGTEIKLLRLNFFSTFECFDIRIREIERKLALKS